VGGEAELALLLHIYPEGVEELDGAYAVYADEPPVGFDVVESGDVPEGWEDEWRSFHHGVRVGRLWVGPPWETVVIEPGRAFGTGAHPTTRLILGLLQDVERGSLLDVGCGSGVLSIAAAKLGFAPVLAVDVDSVAVETTRENAARNGVQVESRLADAFVDPLPRVDAVLANIALDVVERLAPRLDARVLMTSGYLDRDEPSLSGWRKAGRRTADGWAADLYRRID
jgi:ribosomal protein L11 methyltransferase